MITKRGETGQKRPREKVLTLAGIAESVIYYNMYYYVCVP